jgi:hypothetical protein
LRFFCYFPPFISSCPFNNEDKYKSRKTLKQFMTNKTPDMNLTPLYNF